MDKLIFKICDSEQNVIRALEESVHDAQYEIKADGLDCKLELFDIDEDMADCIMDLFADVIYADTDVSLAQRTIGLLYDNNLSMAAAESCTGGMLSSMLIDVPGSSDVFYEGVVSYSNLSKMDRLSVAEDTISEYGAVSEETALEMAQGLLKDNVIIGVSTTGIAGPGGATESKPVGLVYVTVANLECFRTYKHLFYGERNDIRKFASQKALFHTIEFLLENYNAE